MQVSINFTKQNPSKMAIIFLLFPFLLAAQNAPFSIHLEPVNIPNVGGIQSYAFAQHEGKWLIIGGRLDGLHRRQPWATFDVAGHNTSLIVIDPVAQQKWTAPLASLPVPLQEQLSSTNMEFAQDGDHLYLVGGYGYSATAGDHVTYDKLTAVDVPGVVEAIIAGAPIAGFFRQKTDAQFAVTGGHLNKVYDTFYLTGGQRFDGRYNPMNGPSFTQTYTDAIRKFKLLDDGTTLTVAHLPAIVDADNLHRRDYNVAPQIMPNGQEGLTAFSGVFQKTVDLPYLNCVNVDSSGYSVNNDFSQYYNHYHCAFLPLYSASQNEMHTVFFGGIAQFYDSLGVLVQDNNVPFVRTIARVTRDADGLMTEYKLPVEMPDLLGASSEFIPNEGLPMFPNGVLKLDELPDGTSFVGYIYGGIASSAPNVFWINTGTESTASSQVYKVSVVKSGTSATHQVNAQSRSSLHMQVFPNPNNGEFSVKFNLKEIVPVQWTLTEANGAVLEKGTLTDLELGENIYRSSSTKLKAGNAYFVSLKTPDETASLKVIVTE
ncbi:MAG: T9SS type A sorting domain-containing protein [Saprospiraceae bacterium]|nr:T9SS type A sorting domain-containing protein [Saprospiraceae bacterium]